jgi:hypothetical protein
MATSSLQTRSDGAEDNLVVRDTLVVNNRFVANKAFANQLDVGALDVQSLMADDLMVDTLTVSSSTDLSGPVNISGQIIFGSSIVNGVAISLVSGSNQAVVDAFNGQINIQTPAATGILNPSSLVFNVGGTNSTMSITNTGMLGQTFNLAPLPAYDDQAAAVVDGLLPGDLFTATGAGVPVIGTLMVA